MVKNIGNYKVTFLTILFTKLINIFTLEACSSVDRASDSDSESQGFDSLHAYISFIQNWGCFGFDI